MIKQLIAVAAMAASALAFAQQNHRDAGNVQNHHGAEMAGVIKSQTDSGKGQTAQQVGNMTYWRNGQQAQQVGNMTYYSNGVRAQQVGNMTYYSNGRQCQQVGAQTYCR